MPEIIGVVGFAGSGKDTVGNELISKYGYSKESFAGTLKDLAAVLFGWPRDMLEGATKESREWREQPDEWWEAKLEWSKHPGRYLGPRFTPRIALQLMGTDVMRRHFHDDIWIISLQNKLRGRDKVVITDCRFPNEIRAIRSMGGRVVRVMRGPEPDWYSTADAANSDTFLHAPECYEAMLKSGIHISEWAWIGTKFDGLIGNNGTLEDLSEKVAWLVK